MYIHVGVLYEKSKIAPFFGSVINGQIQPNHLRCFRMWTNIFVSISWEIVTVLLWLSSTLLKMNITCYFNLHWQTLNGPLLDPESNGMDNVFVKAISLLSLLLMLMLRTWPMFEMIRQITLVYLQSSLYPRNQNVMFKGFP